MINVNNLSFSYSSTNTIFQNIHFKIDNNKRVALIGSNGTGKTTLLNLIGNKLSPDSGYVKIDGYCKLVPQFSDSIDKESPGENQLRRLREGFLAKPDVLLLDEPTSNLDQDGINFLIQRIHTFKGILLIVSHDVSFISAVTNSVLEIADAKVKLYNVSFENFKQIKDKDLNKKYNLAEVEKKKRTKDQKALERMQNKANSSKKASKISSSDKKSKGLAGKRDKVQKGLEKKAKKIKRNVTQDRKVTATFESNGFKLLTACQYPKKLEYNIFFKDLMISNKELIKEPIRLKIKSDEAIFILGSNGSGKTTLLNEINKKLLADKIRVSFFQQKIQDNWNITEKLITQLQQKSGINNQIILDVAGALGITKDLLNRTSGELSGGQLLKVQLVLQLIKPFDVLLLDEPTNYLDLDGVVALTKFINESHSAIVIVSHDKQFIENCSNKCYFIKDHKWIDYLECYYFY